MKKTTARTALVALTTATLFANSAMAEIKYWDNPDYREFKVSDYAPGAVWNFDGIDNAAGGSHSASATKWRNLGSSGANNDVWVRYQNSSGGWANSSAPSGLGGGMGTWAANGFKLTGGSEWRASGSGSVAQIDTGASYTLQMLVTGSHSGQPQNKSFLMSVQQSEFSFYTDKANKRLYWGTQNATTANHPYITGDNLGYMTAILNGSKKTAAFFTGTKAPTSGSGFRQFSSVAGKTDNGYCLGGYTGSDGQFVGTIHSYRYYKRVLSDTELAWNRVVDEARFFGRKAPIPVTNVVVATSVANAGGYEPVGCYAVKGRHIFAAPATVTVGGVNYIRTGYTIETRKGSGWSEPVFHKTTLFQVGSYEAKDTECVRLTWKWVKAEGLYNPLTVRDYVWKDLKVFYDAINNVATNKPHTYVATKWANLVAPGGANDAIVQRLNKAGDGWVNASNLDTVDGRCPGRWTDDGFVINGEGRFRCNAPGGFTVGKSYSLQMLVDAKASDQVTGNAFLLGANVDKLAFQLRKSDGLLIWKTLGADADNPYMTRGSYDYMTAIMREKKQTFFDGVVEPTSGKGYRANNAAGYSETGYCLGGYGKELVTDRFVGTFKSFRQYDRALTAAEIAQNRKVDNWRYYGIPDRTNVLVVSTHSYLQGNEPDGAYALNGKHTFTAPESLTAKGIDYKCDGYTVEKWDNDNGWSSATRGSGTKYTYSTSAGKVRLTWRWVAEKGLRTAKDYGFEDYSQAGIVWHFDGKFNRGLDAARNSSATTWKNLVPNSAPSKLTLQRLNKEGDAYVNGDDQPLDNLATVDGRNPGSWLANGGFKHFGASSWRGLAQVGPLRNCTIQTLVDANVDDIDGNLEFLVNVSRNNLALAMRRDGGNPGPKTFYFATQGDEKCEMCPYVQNELGRYGFATAILDESSKSAKMFSEATVPAANEIHDGCRVFDAISTFKDRNFRVGASTSMKEMFVGTIKNVRYYDRVLTEEEIVRNRNVDAVRYFGALGVTNVFVVAGGGSQAETGAYTVEGTWVFKASTVMNSDGQVVPVARYMIETFVDGKRESKEVYEGSSFVYSVANTAYRGKVVRLTWKPASPGTFLMLE